MSAKEKCSGDDLVIASLILESLGTYGKALARRVRSGEFRAVLSAVVNPSGFSCWQDFFRAYQASTLLRKYPGLPTGIDLAGVAIRKFIASEEICGVVNERLRKPFANCGVEIVELLTRARDFIHRTLGEFSWDATLRHCDFGPGANVGIPRKRSHQLYKIGMQNPTVTRLCLPLYEAYMRFDPHMADLGATPRIVRGSKATTVPKDARSDRFIAIEPLWNMFFQKGIGGSIRHRLRRVGLDLNHGQVVNQELALRGSLDGSLATLDLSAASDSIASFLVEYLLPRDWYDAMATVRSPECEMPDGSWVFLRKISSMGNGFTFELESLIFLALVYAVHPSMRVGHDVSVYGDDIILPASQATRLVELLSIVGFKTNVEKSFITGPFRESCGKHFFNGRDVTPFYLKKVVRTIPDLYWFANSIRRLAHRFTGMGYGCDARFKPAWDLVLSRIPDRFRRLSCPDGYGDSAVLRDFDECTPSPRPATGWVEGYTSFRLLEAGKVKLHEGPESLISKLWYTRRGLRLGELSQRNLEVATPSNRYRITKGLYPQWSTLGPWL